MSTEQLIGKLIIGSDSMTKSSKQTEDKIFKILSRRKVIDYETMKAEYERIGMWWLITMKIKEIRNLTLLTQEQFSKQYNIPLPTLRHWERGDRECPNYVLELLEFKVKNDYKK